ncbi:hemagglutinin protein [Veronia nyctiphanis]|uniref:Hemagglutinin protein n=1 Tax=Veronia nyctiphanis TaxID=1278244 RepID=A0A4Q0YM08_9GAMM|nr:tetratricopeptide repeat protein [Veronia nyctiphanis]RXJ71862.1 hemagglutinin protein [Veronia nyctiphanis]
MYSKPIIVFLSAFLFACAGPNPNTGERTTDLGWTSGNYQQAFDTAKIYAEQGQPWAQLRLGIFYANGWGVDKDEKIASSWYQKAAAQTATGDWANGQIAGATGKTGFFNQNSDALIAKFNLAQLYFEGAGVEKDLSKSLELVNKVITESNGESVLFCCEFSSPRYFTQEQFIGLKSKIEKELSAN